jgi:acyl carrier protein
MAATDQEVQAFVLRFVREVLNQPVDANAVDQTTALGSGGLELESLAFIELSLHIEKQFGVTIPDDQLEAIAGMSLGEFGAYVTRRARAADATV